MTLRVYWRTGGMEFSLGPGETEPRIEEVPLLLLDHLIRQYQFSGYIGRLPGGAFIGERSRHVIAVSGRGRVTPPKGTR